MHASPESIQARVVRIERELYFWRIVGLCAAVCLTLAFALPQTEKTIRLSSFDGKQIVELTANGLALSDGKKTLARLGFDAIGDSDNLEANLKLTGGVSAGAPGFAIQDGKDRALFHANLINFLQGTQPRATLSFDGLMLSDPHGKGRIVMSVPEAGMSSLTFLDRQNMILSLGALGNFRVDPRRSDVGAILINDFGSDSRSRLITPTESELHTKNAEAAKAKP